MRTIIYCRLVANPSLINIDLGTPYHTLINRLFVQICSLLLILLYLTSASFDNRISVVLISALFLSELSIIFRRYWKLNLATFILLLTSGGFAVSEITFTEKLFNFVKNTYSQDAEKRVRDWQSVLLKQKDKSTEEQLYAVNRFFNEIEFVDDKTHWGKNDYWATPIEFLATNAGDCEDFTIAKYFSLIELGVPEQKLRLMYVTATRPRQAHMVLAYYETPKSVPLVLDNINKRILPATQRRDLIPIYSFNGDGLWHAKSQGQGRRLQSKNNNSLWDDLTQRMNQGF